MLLSIHMCGVSVTHRQWSHLDLRYVPTHFRRPRPRSPLGLTFIQAQTYPQDPLEGSPAPPPQQPHTDSQNKFIHSKTAQGNLLKPFECNEDLWNRYIAAVSEDPTPLRRTIKMKTKDDLCGPQLLLKEPKQAYEATALIFHETSFSLSCGQEIFTQKSPFSFLLI